MIIIPADCWRTVSRAYIINIPLSSLYEVIATPGLKEVALAVLAVIELRFTIESHMLSVRIHNTIPTLNNEDVSPSGNRHLSITHADAFLSLPYPSPGRACRLRGLGLCLKVMRLNQFLILNWKVWVLLRATERTPVLNCTGWLRLWWILFTDAQTGHWCRCT